MNTRFFNKIIRIDQGTFKFYDYKYNIIKFIDDYDYINIYINKCWVSFNSKSCGYKHLFLQIYERYKYQNF